MVRPTLQIVVASREGRVSRNCSCGKGIDVRAVASREGRVSRNDEENKEKYKKKVASREGRVSRNLLTMEEIKDIHSRVPRGTCE